MAVRRQEVEIYYDSFKATKAMREHISSGWIVHSCTMSCYMAGSELCSRVIVVYEKEEQDGQ